MTDEQADSLRRAIAMATAGLTENDPGQNLHDLFQSYAEDDPLHAVKAVIGLQNLVQLLLARLEEATGTKPIEELQAIARRVS